MKYFCSRKENQYLKTVAYFLCYLILMTIIWYVSMAVCASVLPKDICHPVILSGKYPIARLIIVSIHENTSHQGRHLTEGAVRNKGFWILGGKGIVTSVIHRCVNYKKKNRGELESQKMTDLSIDRFSAGPPFPQLFWHVRAMGSGVKEN